MDFLPKPLFVMKRKSEILKAGASTVTSTVAPAFFPFTFVGAGLKQDPAADSLLTKMIEAMGLQRNDVPVLESLTEYQNNSKVLIILGEQGGFSGKRGAIHDYQGVKTLVTEHPSNLVKNPALKKDCWNDLQYAMKEIGWKK